MNDTRRDKRAPVSLKVRFKSATLDEFREQYSIDISRGGLFIKSKSPMSVGTLLKFEFQLKDKSRLIHGVGRVVWVRTVEQASDTAPPGMGIKFIKMDPESRTLVQEIIDTRGDQPGRFDEGAEQEGEPEPAAPMFPDLPPAELPPLEDRTAVRHASEFLASALAAGDAGASAEAEQIAEEARQRAAARAATEIELTGAAAEAARTAGMKAPTPETADAAPKEAVEPAASATAAASPAQETKLEPTDTATKPSSERPAAPAAEGGGSVKLGWVVLVAILVGGTVFGLRASGMLGASSETTQTAEEALPPATDTRPVEPEPVSITGEAATVEPVAEPEPVVEPVPDEPAVPEAPPVEVRVESIPRGAEIRLGDVVLGETPAEISLPLGVPSALVLHAPGYAPETVEVTPKERTPTVRASLTALPYVVHVESTPPGAVARIGRETATTPGDVTLGRGRGNVILRVSLANHTTATEVFTREDFVQEGEAMRHSVTVTLSRAPARSAPSREAPREDESTAGGREASTPERNEAAPAPRPSPTPEPASAPAPAAPAPAPAPTAPAPAGRGAG